MSILGDQRIQYEARLKALLESLAISDGGGTGEGGTILPSRLTIINYVKAKLDELVPEGTTFSLSSEPNVSDPLDLLINAHLDEATKDIQLTAPLSVLFPTRSSTTTGTPFTQDAKQGYIDLPSNFLRLAQIKMADWQRTLETAITPQNPQYKLQGNEYLRGGIVKPVVVLTWRVSGGVPTRTLEYYSVDSSHAIDKLLYITEQKAEDFIEDNSTLLPSLAWNCAGKIMQILGLAENYKMAMEQVKLSYVNL